MQFGFPKMKEGSFGRLKKTSKLIKITNVFKKTFFFSIYEYIVYIYANWENTFLTLDKCFCQVRQIDVVQIKRQTYGSKSQNLAQQITSYLDTFGMFYIFPKDQAVPIFDQDHSVIYQIVSQILTILSKQHGEIYQILDFLK